jgi:Tol biopolymer transport system component
MLARPDGSEARPLAAAPDADERSARPSPTRDEVAFISDRDGSPDLFLVDLAGGPARNLTRSPGRREAAPRWSPDGERIAISVLREPPYVSGERVAVVDRQGTPLLEVPGTMPDWMPPWPEPP